MQRKVDESLKKVGSVLAELRQEKQLSVVTVFLNTGIEVQELESGQQDIDIDTLNRLCNYYNISLSEFFKMVEDIGLGFI